MFVCLLAFALIEAVPVDETIAGSIGDNGPQDPAEPQGIFKKLLFKKLLLLG